MIIIIKKCKILNNKPLNYYDYHKNDKKFNFYSA